MQGANYIWLLIRKSSDQETVEWGVSTRILYPEKISFQNEHEYITDIYKRTKPEEVHFQETCSKGKANRELRDETE